MSRGARERSTCATRQDDRARAYDAGSARVHWPSRDNWRLRRVELDPVVLHNYAGSSLVGLDLDPHQVVQQRVAVRNHIDAGLARHRARQPTPKLSRCRMARRATAARAATTTLTTPLTTS